MELSCKLQGDAEKLAVYGDHWESMEPVLLTTASALGADRAKNSWKLKLL